MSRPAAVALAADVAFGEPPPPLHPTVWMGRLIGAGRRMRSTRAPAGSLLQGAVLVIGGAAVSLLAGRAAEAAAARLPAPLRPGARGLALKPALSLRALLAAAAAVEHPLRRGNLEEARRQLGWHLVSRETAELSPGEVAGAAIESLAENLSDALVAPLLAFRGAGLGGAYAYRFVNTCDAMLGYRTAELEWFGKAAARADDALNWIPARLSALLIACSAALTGEDAAGALRCMRSDARRTESPNAGWPMAAMAGALGVRLEKRGSYRLNPTGREPGSREIARARAIVAAAGALAVLTDA